MMQLTNRASFIRLQRAAQSEIFESLVRLQVGVMSAAWLGGTTVRLKTAKAPFPFRELCKPLAVWSV